MFLVQLLDHAPQPACQRGKVRPETAQRGGRGRNTPPEPGGGGGGGGGGGEGGGQQVMRNRERQRKVFGGKILPLKKFGQSPKKKDYVLGKKPQNTGIFFLGKTQTKLRGGGFCDGPRFIVVKKT